MKQGRAKSVRYLAQAAHGTYSIAIGSDPLAPPAEGWSSYVLVQYSLSLVPASNDFPTEQLSHKIFKTQSDKSVW